MKILATNENINLEIINYAKNKNIHIDIIPFIKTQEISFKLSNYEIDLYDSLIFTSKKAVIFFFKELKFKINKDKLIFCISNETNKALLKYGIENLIISDINSKKLIKKILNSTSKNILHICSKQKLNILENNLKDKIKYSSLEIYETIKIQNKINELNYDAILFFSPTGVNSFFENNTIKSNIFLCCIGKTTANAILKKYINNNNLLIAKYPSIYEMIDLIYRNKNAIKKN